MSKYLFIILFSFVTYMGVAQDEKVNFDVNVPNRIIVGEPFQVQFVLNASAKDFKMADPEGLEVLYGPGVSRASSTTIRNGKRSQLRSTTFTFTLMASEPGEYKIPSASAKVGSITYKTSERKITVFGAEAAANTAAQSNNQRGGNQNISIGQGELYVVASANKQSVYEQEPIRVNFKLYSLREPSQIPNVKLPDFDGFVKQEVNLNSSRQLQVEEVNGQLFYTVDIYSVLLFPQKPGKLTIPSGSFDISMLVRLNTPVENFFGSFQDQYREVNKTVKSRPITIDVKALPEPKPDGFSGAVGQYTLERSLSGSILKTNESISLKYTLKGSGNIKLVKIPEPKFPEGFDMYDPKEEEDITASSSGSMGKKTKEFYAVPRYIGDFVIPESRFAYFDPSAGSYKSIVLPEIRLHVDKGEGGGDLSPIVSGFNGKEDVKYLGEDIRYIKSADLVRMERRRTFSLSSFYFLLFLILLTGFIIYLIDIHREKNNIDTAVNRSKKAGRKARKYLLLANKNREGADAGVFYELLLKGLNSYLSDKFHIPLSELSKENIERVLSENSVSSELTSKVLTILSDLELARYAPMEERSAKDELYRRAADAIDRLERTKTLKRKR